MQSTLLMLVYCEMFLPIGNKGHTYTAHRQFMDDAPCWRQRHRWMTLSAAPRDSLDIRSGECKAWCQVCAAQQQI